MTVSQSSPESIVTVASPCGTSSLTIPAQVAYAGIASVYVEAVASMYGFGADQSRQLAQSLLIILQDLISQAFGPGENQDVQISAQPLPIGLKITIGEKGLPLSSAELASLAADPQACPLVRLDDHLTCVREIWDEASFYNLGRAGAQLDLVKYFTRQAELLHQVCPVAPLTPPPGRPAAEPETFTVRPFSPAEAQEVVRLLYRTYGYSYPYEHLYYPERLIALNADGSLLSLVAVSSHDEVVGHLAMFFSKENAALAEMGAAVVHPDFRGHGCLRWLTEYALAEGRRRQLQALYARPVTNHIYSQKVSEDLGFKPCGLLVGFGPAFMSFKKIHEDLPQRESMILIYRSLLPMTPAKIYLPSRHRNFILQIYTGLGLNPETDDFNIESSFDRLPPGKLDITMFGNGGIAVLKIKAIGPDTLAEIRRNLKHLCLARFEVIHLQLDLCQASVSQLVPQCESLGFFFAGLLPGLNNTHSLILQYLNNVPLDYEKIQLHSPQAVKLLEYVQQADPNLA